jgi:hypothetical protein
LLSPTHQNTGNGAQYHIKQTGLCNYSPSTDRFRAGGGGAAIAAAGKSDIIDSVARAKPDALEYARVRQRPKSIPDFQYFKMDGNSGYKKGTGQRGDG